MKVSEEKKRKTLKVIQKEKRDVELQVMDVAALPTIWEVAAEEVNQAAHMDAVAQESMIWNHSDQPIFLIN